jgi:hypothetical protein
MARHRTLSIAVSGIDRAGVRRAADRIVRAIGATGLRVQTVHSNDAPASPQCDVAIVDGLFLLRRGYTSAHDVAVWVDCSFATARERNRLTGEELDSLRLHLEVDDPISATQFTIQDDSRLPRGLKRVISSAAIPA